MNLRDLMEIPVTESRIKKVTIITIVSLFIFLLVLVVVSVAWAYQYHDRIGPNVHVGDLDLSGLDRYQAKALLQDRVDHILSEGIDLSTSRTEGTKKLTLATVTDSDFIEETEFDLNQTIDRALILSHESNLFLNTYRLLTNKFTNHGLTVPVELNESTLKESIYQLFPNSEPLSEEPSFVFPYNGATWSGEVLPGRPGTEFLFDPFFELLQTRLSVLDASPIKIKLISRIPSLTNQEAEAQIVAMIRLIETGPLTLSYTDEATTEEKTWTMTERDIANILKPSTGTDVFDREAFDLFLERIATDIEQPAQDARIDIENGRVVNFVQSQKGVRLDRDSIYAAVVSVLTKDDGEQINEPIRVVTNTEDPTIETGDVNDLGITQVLGFGTSSYRGSPANRRANIQNGVKLLNGLLIAPDEVFSLIQALQPFTSENGYLPELVIKGDRITPEIAGGLCQIGTTTFRSVMNSGLPVTERRNHSLVVSYYNDPSNGNPGTDATLYDPAPDFKFTNDTGRYVLFQAENLTQTQELRFTLWGTTDGRQGSYTPPVVNRWIPTGPTKRIETTDLEVGKEQCQSAHVGADTTFDYTVTKADGTSQVVTFESHYRPLPQICLVGVEKLTEPTTETTLEDSSPAAPVQNDTPQEVIPTLNLNN